MPSSPPAPDIVLTSRDGARAEVLAHGAHVTHWRPAGGEERLFVSALSTYEDGKAIRGGVPVIFPQFSDSGPFMRHGFCRLVKWEIGQVSENRATLRLRDTDYTRGLWPHAFAATLTVEIGGATLRMTLQIRNTGDAPFAFTSALHTYLRVSDLPGASVEGLQDLDYLDQTTHQKVPEDQPTVTFNAEVDRAYLLGGARSVVLRDAERHLRITASGFPDVVVWNPGAETGAKIHDLEPNGYQSFVCVEAAAVGSPVTLAPNESWEGTQTLQAG